MILGAVLVATVCLLLLPTFLLFATASIRCLGCFCCFAVAAFVVVVVLAEIVNHVKLVCF